jgi:outer membrane receptor for ferrienterochelin and colicins
MRRHAFRLALLCAVASARLASAADPPPDEEGDIGQLKDVSLQTLLDTPVEVWSATKFASKVEDVAAIVTVYSRDDIRNWGYRSVAELLAHTVGFDVIDDHVAPNVGVRGVSGGLGSESGTLKVMIDGHSVAFRSTGGNFLGPELLPLSAIERVEIIRGPGSALYGADAFLGVVNIITRDGAKLDGADLSAAIHVNGGNVGTGQDVSVGAKVGPAAVLFSYRHDNRDLSGLRLPGSSPSAFIPPYSSRRDGALGLVQDSHTGYGKVHFALDKVKITLSGYGALLDREAAFSPWIQLAYGTDKSGRQNENHVSLLHGHLAAKVELVVSKDAEVTLDTVFFRGGPTGRDRLEAGSDVYFVKREFGFVGIDSNLDFRYRIRSNLTAVAGVGLVVDQERLPSTLYGLKTQIGDLPPGTIQSSVSVVQPTKNLLNPSAYALALWTPFQPELGLTGGFRYDYHNIYGDQFSGRVGAVSNPIKDLHVKALYGTAFKAPSPLLLYGLPVRAGDIVGNEDLRPQYVHTIEGQVSYKPIKQLTLATNVAYSFVIDKAEFIQQGVNKVARNLSDLRSLSWETEARFKYAPWIEAYGTLEINHVTRNLGDIGYQADLIGNDNVIYPSVLGRTGVMGTVPNVHLRATVEGSFVGSRRASDDNILAAGRSYTMDPYFLLDATISTVDVKLINDKETTISVTGRNLTGARVAVPGFGGVDYPIEPRSFMVQLRQVL